MTPDTGSETAPHPYLAHTAAARGLASCHVCARVSPVAEQASCPRCGAALHLRKVHSIQRTAALTITAAILYLPANILPVMTVRQIGSEEQNTILGGVVTFWKSGSYGVAAIIFTASVIIPILKFIALTWLCFAARGHGSLRRPGARELNPRQATKIYRVTEIVGRWSMVDVFVVAVMVAVVQFGSIMTISPGPAALSFAGVVVLTMLAASAFDPRLLWDRVGPEMPVRALSLPLTLPRPRVPIDQSATDDR